MPKQTEPDDADMPPRAVDVSRPFVRLRIWHAESAAYGYLGITQPDGTYLACCDPAQLDEFARAWLAHREME
jgi:hypothetical protein